MVEDAEYRERRGLHPEDPTRIGRYRVLRRLGSGGMAVVYAAYDPELDRQIAVKRLDPVRFSASDPRVVARFQREAQSMARVSHPHVCPVYDVGVEDDSIFIAMELVHGLTLRHWQQETARPWTEVMRMYLQAGRGIAAAHRASLVHRDFKPENVLVGDDGRARVVDFGLARAAPMEGEEEEILPADTHEHLLVDDDAAIGESLLTLDDGHTDNRVTHTGLIAGTPAYMAPEQHMGHPASPKSDQFSFCVALWEALYFERPFEGKTAFAIADAIIEGRLNPPPRRSRVPHWVHLLIRQGLARDPRDRHESMQSLLAALVFTGRIIHGA